MEGDEARAETADPARISDDPEALLLRVLGQGDRAAAAGLLVTQHGAVIGRTCMALLGSQSEAEEALQETLMAALDGFSGFRAEGSLRAWLLGIARKRCARRLEARGRERDLRKALPEPEPAPSPERVTLAARAHKLLSEVRPSEREALILRFSADLSFREVAEACGVDEATARKRASRGLARLRELFGEK